jgi:hypothetical protein
VSRALLLAGCLVLGCGAGDPCAGVAGTCLTVHVDPSSAVARVDRLDFEVTAGADHGLASTRAPGGGVTSLPVATAVELGTLAAPTLVSVVVGGELAGTLVGQGMAAMMLANGAHASLHLQLDALSTDGGVDLANDNSDDDGGGAADLALDCKVGGLYCGDKVGGNSSTLYLCNAGGTTVRGKCTYGCVDEPSGNDACNGGGGACVVGGHYCGGDKLTGDPQTLYVCQSSGQPTVFMHCANACKIVTGNDDVCQ